MSLPPGLPSLERGECHDENYLSSRSEGEAWAENRDSVHTHAVYAQADPNQVR